MTDRAAAAAMQQAETIADMRGGEVRPTDEDLYALIKPLWLAEKPSHDAQGIRAALSVSVDDARFRERPLDYVPEYVWDLVDIAAQRGIKAGRESNAGTLTTPDDEPPAFDAPEPSLVEEVTSAVAKIISGALTNAHMRGWEAHRDQASRRAGPAV